MRASILALALLAALAPGLSLADPLERPLAFIAPTAPPGDNGDRIANTAWVNNFFAAGLPLSSGKIFVGSAGNLAPQQTPSGDCTLSVSGVITCTKATKSDQQTGTSTTAIVTPSQQQQHDSV